VRVRYRQHGGRLLNREPRVETSGTGFRSSGPVSKNIVSARGADRPTMNRNRRTRDRVRLIFWAALSLVCLLLVIVARQQQQASLDRKVDAAESRATRYTNVVIRGHLDRATVSAPLAEGPFGQVLTDVQRKVLVDERVARVLIWGPDGALVFSSEGPVSATSDRVADETAFESASTGSTVSGVLTVTMPARAGHPRGPTDLLQTYVPLETESGLFFGAVEIDHYHDVLVDAASRPWGQLQVAFGVVGAVCAVMVLLSFWWSLKPMSEEDVAARLDRAALKGAKAAGREGAKQTRRDTKAIDSATSEVEKLRAKVADAERAQRASKQQALQLQEQITRSSQQVQAAENQLAAAQRAAQDAAEGLRVAGETERQLRAEVQLLREEAARVPEPPAGPSHEVFEAIRADLERAREEVREAQDETRRARTEADELRAGAELTQQQLDELRAGADEARREAAAAAGRLDAVQAQANEAQAGRSFARDQLADAQRKLDEATTPPTEPAIATDAKARIEELEEEVRGLEQERAMLRAGRPETVYEVRNRELQAELKEARERLKAADGEALDAKAMAAGIAPNVLATIEERLTAAERRAEDAERRLGELEPVAAGNGDGASNGNGAPNDNGAGPEGSQAQIDGSELRSRLVRAADRKRMGADQHPRR
jgi:predicted  nucleic acid-binding Zn-ribbon protein